MQNYLELLKHVLTNGALKADRTGTGTLSVFGYQMRFDLTEGFPLVTTKKVHVHSLIHELLWFLAGNNSIDDLERDAVKIWSAWKLEDGTAGRNYSKQWREWQKPDGTKLDQIATVVESLKTNPDSRRHLVVAYNPGEVELTTLPPCHSFFQFYVANNKLSCQLYQRSADLFLGVPFNIASYALLTHMIAQVVGLQVGEFVHTLGDAHIYVNHVEQVKLQLKREPYPLPTLHLNPEVKDIFEFKYEDIRIQDYQHHPAIKAPVAV